MTFEAALYNYLSTYASLAALVSTRVYPMVRIQSATAPTEDVVYETPQDRRYQQFSGQPTATRIILRMTAYGRTSPLVKAVAAQIYAALQGYTLGVNDKLMGGIAFTASASTDTLTSAAHGFTEAQRLRAANTGGALPAGLSAGVDYYARNVTANTLQLSATSGGLAIDLTTDGSGANTIGNVVIGSCLSEDWVDDYDDDKGEFVVTQEFGTIYRLG